MDDDSPRTILVVDDDDAGRYATAHTLRRAGYSVLEAATAAETLLLAADLPDLVLLDVNLPDDSGLHVAETLKRDPVTARIPIIHLSATHIDADARAQGLESGADAYLAQPVPARELLATVQAMLRLHQGGRGVRSSPELLDALVTSSPDAIFVKDLDGRYLHFNPAAETIAGKSAAEVLGRDDAAVFGEAGPPSLFAVGRGMANNLGTIAFESSVTDAKGQERRFLTIEGPLYDEHGRPYATFGMARDTTERDRAEEDLRQYATQFDAFFNATDDMAFVKDGGGRYVLGNASLAAFFHRGPEDVIGHTDSDLLPAPIADASERDERAVLERDELLVSRRTVDDRVYETRRFPVELATGGTGIGGYSRDVTDRIRAEEEVLRLNAELEARVERRTEELELANRELEAFSYSVSHDLRAPLRAIDGFSQILLEDNLERLDEAGRENLGRVRAAAERMALLIDDLLRLSRLSRGQLQLQETDLSALARETAEELRAAEPGRAMEFDIHDGLHATADAQLVRIVLQNLMANAVKFTSRHESAHIEVGGAEHRGAPAFYVRDDGAGFDMAYAGKMFAAFQRLHGADEFPGTGIGLATVQRVVHRHHGRVWAEGAVEQGATIWFTLPGDVD